MTRQLSRFILCYLVYARGPAGCSVIYTPYCQRKRQLGVCIIERCVRARGSRQVKTIAISALWCMEDYEAHLASHRCITHPDP